MLIDIECDDMQMHMMGRLPSVYACKVCSHLWQVPCVCVCATDEASQDYVLRPVAMIALCDWVICAATVRAFAFASIVSIIH